jgi:hypothetical protein
MKKIVCFVFLIVFYEFGFGQQPELNSASCTFINNEARNSTTKGNPGADLESFLRLDSVVTYVYSVTDSVGQYKTLYGYDVAGKTTSEIHYNCILLLMHKSICHHLPARYIRWKTLVFRIHHNCIHILI